MHMFAMRAAYARLEDTRLSHRVSLEGEWAARVLKPTSVLKFARDTSVVFLRFEISDTMRGPVHSILGAIMGPTLQVVDEPDLEIESCCSSVRMRSPVVTWDCSYIIPDVFPVSFFAAGSLPLPWRKL